MHTRTTTLAATLLSFAILHSAFFINRAAAQSLAQPSLLETGTTTPEITPGAAAPTVNREPGTVNPTPTPTPRPGEEEEIVEMSVFEVNAGADEGYQAMNTTSGSRLNMSLRDTAASIQPFTQEFLDDVGATSLADILSYSGNVEADAEDSDYSFNNSGSRLAGANTNAFRVRGIAAGVSLDYTETGVPIDLYNIDRVEMTSGPNSILFGVGNQGGLLSLTSKRANLQRNTLRYANTLGTFIDPGHAWHYFRTTLDYNVVLKPRQLAFRVTGVYQDGDNTSWQNNRFNRVKRINPLITLRPWKTMTISLGLERGLQRNSTFRTWNAADGLTAWLDAGRPIMEAFGTSATPGNITYFTPNGRNTYTVPIVTTIRDSGINSYVLVANSGEDATPQMFNYRQAYRSNNHFPTNMERRWQNRLPPDISSYYYNTVGPSGFRQHDFKRFNASIQQRAGIFNFELAFHHNKVKSYAHAPNGNDATLYGDPNGYLSSTEWIGNGPAYVVENPNAGRLYMESNWIRSFNNQENNVIRFTTETSINSRKYGRHRLVVFAERAHNNLYTRTEKEILIDDNQRAINNQNSPVGARNELIRRQYVTEGDFSTYYDGDWRIPAPSSFYINDKAIHPAYITTGRQSAAHTKRTINSAMLNLGSHWFQNSLVTSLGLRYDDVTFAREKTTQLKNINDSRIVDKTRVWNEWDLSGSWRPDRNFNTNTISTSAVWHAPGDRASLFVNYSSNIAAPHPNRQVLPHGDLPDPAKGRNFEYGVMFSITKKVFLRLNHFDTRQLGDAAITPNGTGGDQSAALGSQNLYDITDALFFLTPTVYTSASPNPVAGDPYAGWLPDTGVTRGADGRPIGMGPMPYEMYAATNPDPDNPDTWPFGAPPQYNAGTVDVIAQGYEAQITANISKRFTLIFNFSHTARRRESIFPEIIAYYNKMIPIWLEMAGRTNPATGEPYMVSIPNADNNAVDRTVPLTDYIRAHLFGTQGNIPLAPDENETLTGLREGLNTQLENQSGSLGSRPWKFNITARYSFQRGFLKGVAIGGSIRYSSYNLMARVNSDYEIIDSEGNVKVFDPDTATSLDLNTEDYTNAKRMVRGDDLWNGSCFLTYRRKLFGGRVNGRFQINVNNIFNSNIITVGQYNAYGGIRRIYQNDPRSIRISAEFNF